jgi:replicative DNA helicase
MNSENINNIERAILGMFFINNSVYDELNIKGITPELFYTEQHKKIFSVIKAMQEKKLTVDFPTFNSYITENKLKIDISYVAGLTDELPSTANADYYINQFIKNYKTRILKDKLNELANNLQNDKTGEIEKQIEDVTRELNEINNNIFYNLTNEDYEKNNAFSDLCNFISNLDNGIKKDPIKTGFDNLDKILDGGLFTGLYTIGAISSAGKTTLCLQIADQIAKAGNDVLIFSLEMAKEELMSKSLSRTTYQLNKLNAVTTREILKFNKKDLGNDKIINLNNALQVYGEYSKNIFFNIGIGDIGTEKIRKVINTHIHHRNRKPVVFIDYLQILAPPNDRLTDKQVLDKNIVELKRISRDFDIPVFAISSFNRESYTKDVNLSSFKESGAIEYTADVLLGLQPLGMIDEKSDGTNNKKIIEYNNTLAKAGKEIAMELKVLKYRTGAKGKTEFLYKPMFETYRAPNKEETRDFLMQDIKTNALNEKPPAGNQSNVSKKEKQNNLAGLFNNDDEE